MVISQRMRPSRILSSTMASVHLVCPISWAELCIFACKNLGRGFEDDAKPTNDEFLEWKSSEVWKSQELEFWPKQCFGLSCWWFDDVFDDERLQPFK